jgi:UDP-N-acetylmuramyl pentapeptide phosphotransferase/UDP-N-acetylglucosamine-1-phosphate transferase
MLDGFLDNLFFSLITAFAITFLAIPSIISVAKIKHLFDEPGERKLHSESIPTLGGLGILAGFIFSMSFWTDFSMCWSLQHVFTAMIVIAFIGIKDDIVSLSPFKKALGQLLAALIIVIWADIRITHVFGIFGIGEIHEIVSVVFTTFTIFIIINAFNLIDGINGLAATQGIISAFTFGIYFYMTKESYQFAIISFALVGALFGFLRYNLTPAKIFMGDTGSMLVGLLMAILCVQFIALNVPHSPILHRLTAAPVVAMSVIFVPLFDLLRVFSIRIYKKQSPFRPDQNHLHHLLLRLGFSHTYATFILGLLSIFLITTAFLLNKLGTYWLGLIQLAICLAFTWLLNYRIRKKGEQPMNGE